MIKSIKIEGYKKFRNKTVELTDLKKINIFIGTNGSGKSSILELLGVVSNFSAFNDQIKDSTGNYNKRYSLFEPSTKISITDEAGVHELVIIPKEGSTWESTKNGKPNPAGNLIIWKAEYSPFETHINTSQDPFTFINTYNFNDYLRGVNMTDRIEAYAFLSKINNNSKILKTITIEGKKHLTETTDEVQEKYLAGGVQQIAILISAFRNMKERHQSRLLFDDLGDALYPAVRKEVIPFIKEKFKEIDSGWDKSGISTQAFITTHNIEIVKAALDNLDYCNIYMFNHNGELIEFENSKQKVVTSSAGIKDSEAISVISSMLGFKDLDLGFPEIIILTEEETKKTFLEKIRNNTNFISKIKKFDVVVPFQAGDDKVPEAIKGLLDLSKYFFFSDIWSDRYVIFVDCNEDYYNQNGTAKENSESKSQCALRAAQANLKDNFILTSSKGNFVSSMEDTYPPELWQNYKALKNISEDNIKDWLSSSINSSEKSKRKNELAFFMGETITEEQFCSNYKRLSEIILNKQSGLLPKSVTVMK